jgi:dTDP-4-dehydrorhamnose reductase
VRKRRILITGASGLLGLNLALETSAAHQVYAQAHSRPLHAESFTTVQLDLLAPGEVQRLLDLAQPDWVIHCAALADIDACERDPQQARQLNSEIPRLLARYVARGGARLLHVSTDAVFDGVSGGYTEEDEPHPLSVYARTKLDGERAVAEEDPQALIARVNLFGWSLSGHRSLAEFFFNKLNAGERCKGFTDVLFCPMLANDLGLLFLKMLEAGLSGLYHAVGSECISKYDFGCRIARIFGFDESLVVPTRIADSGLLAARSPNLTLSTTKLSRALGSPLPGVSTGLAKFYTQYQQGYAQKLTRLIGN